VSKILLPEINAFYESERTELHLQKSLSMLCISVPDSAMDINIIYGGLIQCQTGYRKHPHKRRPACRPHKHLAEAESAL